jgi:hypothetical protein
MPICLTRAIHDLAKTSSQQAHTSHMNLNLHSRRNAQAAPRPTPPLWVNLKNVMIVIHSQGYNE